INEVTSVAGSYAMAQFLRSGQIAGDAFRLRIAAMMSTNIANPVTGAISAVLNSSPNADQTNSLRLTRSLANLINLTAGSPFLTSALLPLLSNEQGQVPADMFVALANLARNPAFDPALIFSLSSLRPAYAPALSQPPDQWTVTVKLHDTGRPDIPFGGAANVAWDSYGYAWVANNVTQGTPNSTKYNVVLRPDGKPADGTAGEPISPFDSGGLLGVGWGVSVDQRDRVWFGNFGWGSPEDLYFPSQTPSSSSGAGTGSVSQFDAADGSPISPDVGYFGPYRVQAIEPDDFGNIWMASFGDTNVAGGSGVWVFRNGDPHDIVSAVVDWENAPFGVAPIPGQAAAWVTFSGGLAGENQSSIARYQLTETGELEQTFIAPVGNTLKVVAADYAGNAWIASQGTDSVFAYSANGEPLGEFTGGGIDGPWGMAVDGEGNIWVANFGDLGIGNVFDSGRVSKLCGANPAACPPGLQLGDPISPETGYTLPSEGTQVLLPNGDPLYGPGAPPSFVPMMRQTSVQIDAAGNLWAVNNWKPRFDVDVLANPGGDGIVIFVGLATPPPR
ncbi:NHL repeat-containing protein, partial [Halochromatium sp.]